jgi:hypothetical protein
MNSRVKIKEAILGEPHGMDVYKGKLSEQELHAITVYLWGRRVAP